MVLHVAHFGAIGRAVFDGGLSNGIRNVERALMSLSALVRVRALAKTILVRVALHRQGTNPDEWR